MDRFPYPDVTSLILVLCEFATFNYDVICGFIFVSTQPTLDILLRIINFRFNIIDPFGVVLKKEFSFSFKISL